MKIGLGRTSVVSDVSVTSPVRTARSVNRVPVESSPVMPSKDAEVLRHRLMTAEVVRQVAPLPVSVPKPAEKRPSVAKRVLMAIGAITVISAGPALFSILALGPIGIALAAGLAFTGMALIRLCKEMN